MFLSLKAFWFLLIMLFLQKFVNSTPVSINNTDGALRLGPNTTDPFATLLKLLPNKNASDLLSQISALNILKKFPVQAEKLQSILTGGKDFSSQFQVTQLLLSVIQKQLETGLKEGNVSRGCADDMLNLTAAIRNKEQWALTMLDASGKLPPGVFRGSFDFVGQYDECRETVSGVIQSNSTSGHVIRGTTCVAYITPPPNLIPKTVSVDSSTPTIRWHLCLPDTCRKDDVIKLMRQVLEPVNFTTTGAFCSDQEKPEFSKDTGAIVSLLIICILMAFLAVGTLLDVLKRYFPKGKNIYTCTVKSNDLNLSTRIISDQITTPEVNGGVVNPVFRADIDDAMATEQETQLDNTASSSSESQEVTVSNSSSSESQEVTVSNSSSSESQEVTVSNGNVPKQTEEIPEHRDPLWQRLLLCFSALRNTEKILSMKPTKGAIGCMHGIRVISMSWVILGHTFVVLRYTVGNPAVLMKYLKSFPFQVVAAGGLAVDTFFVLSGVLTAYLFLRETRKSARVNCKQMVMYYIHRFWRLTPLMMMWIMISTTLMRYVGDGPEWKGALDEAKCRSNGWWQNLLYINNFIPNSDQCFSWTWFLSNDMQFYIISPLVLIPLTYGLNFVGLLVIAAFVLTHMASTGFLVHTYNANMAVNAAKYFDIIYNRPYARIGPYALGLALGYVLLKVKGQVKLSRTKLLCGWFVAAAIAITFMYTPYDEFGGSHQWSALGRGVFEAFYRIGWGLVVCWVIFACSTGNGGIINSILSWDGWLPMSRLTYGTYLVHLLIIFYDVGTERVYGYMSIYNMISKYIGYCIQAYVLSYASALLLESPLLGVEKVLLK